MMNERVSIAVLAYNEAEAISDVLDVLVEKYPDYELLVIDDGSTDGTREIATLKGVRVVSHKVNRGYGAAWKTAIKEASGDTLVFYDGDGQFNPDDVGRLITLKTQDYADMAVGQRRPDSHVPTGRRPGKAVIRHLVQFLAEEEIKDPNCGLRAVDRTLLRRYADLLPDGFSASTTSLLIMLKRGYRLSYLPITVGPRLGKSSVRQVRDGLRTIILLVRLIALFNPLRIFLPLSGALVALSLIYSLYVAIIEGAGIPVLGAVMLIGGLQAFLLGVVCDQISSLRLSSFSTPSEKDAEN